jgi:hypothetical protein
LSHIHSRVIAAVEGKFGRLSIGDPNLSSEIFEKPQLPFINSLMTMYWFFNLEGIVRNNYLVPHIKASRTISEALRMYRANVVRKRDKLTIPL